MEKLCNEVQLEKILSSPQKAWGESHSPTFLKEDGNVPRKAMNKDALNYSLNRLSCW